MNREVKRLIKFTMKKHGENTEIDFTCNFDKIINVLFGTNATLQIILHLLNM